jgi:phage major head subunit gpT-like protein
MLINSSNLRDLQRGYKASFQRGFAGVQPTYTRIATVVPSSTGSEDYAWLGDWPKMREWIGPRVVKNLAEHGYSIKNKEWESTVAVPRPKIEDDQFGIYAPMMEEMGRAAASHPDELVYDLLKRGFATACYDGQNFFDADHPVTDPATGQAASVSNVQDGTGAPWFLLDTTRALKPLIFQDRKKPEFVTKDNPDDERVFDRNEFVYGTYSRCNVGFGFWQMAFGSKAELTRDNLRAARNAMRALTSDEGRKLGINPNLLVVGVSNGDKARDIILAERLENGATNTDRNLVEILEAPLLD